MPGGGCALPGLQPQITAEPGATETAGAGGLNIAETFPEGRGYRVRRLAAPLCAPCAVRDITQKKYWERNLPGNNTGVVALLSAARAGTSPVAPIFRRVAAAPYPAYRAYPAWNS